MSTIHIIDRQPLFPEPVTFAAPRGTRARLKTAAERAGLPAAELLRQALAGILSDQRSAAPRHLTEV